jgi:hypothetical protein
LRKLVLAVLPVLPDPDTIVPVTTTINFSFRGKNYTKRAKGYEYARNVVPPSQWTKHGLSVHAIMAELEAKGFLVRSEHTIRCTLSQARSLGRIESVPMPHRGLGRPRSLYFATE